MPNFATNSLQIGQLESNVFGGLPCPRLSPRISFVFQFSSLGQCCSPELALLKPKKPDVQRSLPTVNLKAPPQKKAPETRRKFLFIRSWSWAARLFPPVLVCVSHKFRHRKLSPYCNWKCKIDGNYGSTASFSFDTLQLAARPGKLACCVVWCAAVAPTGSLTWLLPLAVRPTTRNIVQQGIGCKWRRIKKKNENTLL